MGKKDEDYRDLPGFETKRIPVFIKGIDETRGIVEHFVAIFGNVDAGDDEITKSAFRKTILENKRIRVLDMHNTDSVLRVVGKPLSLREVGRKALTPEVLEYAPSATGGLLAKTQYALNTANGRDVFNLIEGRFIDEASIGYDAVQYEFEERQINGKSREVRILKEIRLWEYSNVIFGMNDATAVVSAKSAKADDPATEADATEPPAAKSVLSFQDLPLAPRGRDWDSDEAEGRVREWAGGEDNMDWDKYATAFLWRDEENPETFGAFKLPIGDILADELAAVPAGIFAAAGALGGARSQELDVPAGDLPDLQDHLSQYYAAMRGEFEDEEIVPPWEKEKAHDDDDEDEEAHKQEEGEDEDTEGEEADDEGEDEDTQTVTLRLAVPSNLDLEKLEQVLTAAFASATTKIADAEEKAGRVLSAANDSDIQQALLKLVTVLARAGVKVDFDALAKENEKRQRIEAGPGAKTPPTQHGEAGPNNGSPTSDEMLLKLRVQQQALDIARVN